MVITELLARWAELHMQRNTASAEFYAVARAIGSEAERRSGDTSPSLVTLAGKYGCDRRTLLDYRYLARVSNAAWNAQIRRLLDTKTEITHRGLVDWARADIGKRRPDLVEATGDSDSWATPPDFWNRLDDEFQFTLDAAASDSNHKCAAYFTELDDGLAREWCGVVWVNPPYSDPAKWVRKAAEEAEKGTTVVVLLKCDVSTDWFKDAFEHAAEIRLVNHRLKFVGADSTAPFDSVIVVFRPGRAGAPKVILV